MNMSKMPAHVCDYAKFHAEDKSKTTRVCDHLDVFVAIWCILIKKQNKTKQNTKKETGIIWQRQTISAGLQAAGWMA